MTDRIIHLDQRNIPKQWYNLAPSLPTPPPPPLHPGTKKPASPEDLTPIFPMALIEQEMCGQTWVDIPEEILDILTLWRPTPLVRALSLERALGTPAKIYFKNEAVSPAGSHKPNTAVAQAYYNKKAGIKRIATETGAGQWGSSLAFATSLFGMKCTVYMVKVSFHQKPYRKMLMQMWGAECHASPSNLTQAGRDILAHDPETSGSLGMAISEAIEDAATHSDTNYSLGSVLNHVLLHQTIIGLEAQKQLARAGSEADIVIGCAGGGSNFAGCAFPFIQEKLEGRKRDIVAVEPAACPTLTRGPYAYDFGDTAKSTPLLKMNTLGHDFVPSPIHAGGLRYHGMAPLVSAAQEQGLIRSVALPQSACFEAAVLFARTEGIVPAPETSHAIAQAIAEARKCKETGEKKTILFNFSGHGHFDMASYDAYFSGKLVDFEYPQEAIDQSLKTLPVV